MSEGKYRTILADPPWPYNDTKGPRSMPEGRDYGVTDGVGSRPRYGSMNMDDLKDLPVKAVSCDNAHLYLWTTNAFMVEAHSLAEAWGFDPKTIITWLKICKEEVRPSYRTGYYYRGATEHLLFAVSGSLGLQGDPHPTALLTPRGQHSQKPDAAYVMIEQQSPTPRLELFARRRSPMFPKRPGWHTWGDEIECDIALT